jgi:hypothetical protein
VRLSPQGRRLVLKILKNAHVFAPEDRGIHHLLIAGGRVAWLAPIWTSWAC